MIFVYDIIGNTTTPISKCNASLAITFATVYVKGSKNALLYLKNDQYLIVKHIVFYENNKLTTAKIIKYNSF